MAPYYSVGVFSYAQNTPGGATIQYVNCSLAIDLDSNIDFPLRLLLVLTGALLIAIDINISILLCFLKYCGCGGLAVVWYIIDCLVLVAWTAWALYYMVAVFPTWQDDRALCENFVMISTLVAVGVSCFFALLYLAVIVIVVCYESRQRLECCQSCCYRPKYRDSDY